MFLSWPYQFNAGFDTQRRICLRLMEPHSPVRALFSHCPFPPDRPPQLMRLARYVLTPVSLGEHRRTGHWWRRRFVGLMLTPMAHDPQPFAGSADPAAKGASEYLGCECALCSV